MSKQLQHKGAILIQMFLLFVVIAPLTCDPMTSGGNHRQHHHKNLNDTSIFLSKELKSMYKTLKTKSHKQIVEAVKVDDTSLHEKTLTQRIREIFKIYDNVQPTKFTVKHPEFSSYDKVSQTNTFTPLVQIPIKCVDNGDDTANKTFCNKVAKYPDIAIINNQLRKLSSFFSEDIIPIDIDERMNTGPDVKYLCNSRLKTIYPEAGQTKNNKWLFIVNKGDFKQGIRIEECERENDTCHFMEALQNNYMATCKQHYIYRRLVALTEIGTTVQDEFRMPSCCKCAITRI